MMKSDVLYNWIWSNGGMFDIYEEVARRLDEDVLVEALESIKKDIEDGNL